MSGAQALNSDKDTVSLITKKIGFVLVAFTIFRLGTYIPIPFIDSAALSVFMSENAGGLLGVLNTFAGGSLSRMSLFALSIMPYITASIIIQLFTVVHKPLADMRKEGEQGRAKIQKITKIFTVILCVFQAYGVSIGLETLRAGELNVVTQQGIIFRLTTVITLTGGTMFLMWLGERITARGIGNGISMLIFAGIVAEFPTFAGRLLEMGESGSASELFIFVFFAILLALLFLVTFVEKSFRKVQVHYARRANTHGAAQQASSYIPLKVNTAGVIPPIFASSFLLFPTTMAGFFNADGESAGTGVIETLARYLAHGQPLYILLYALIIVFFSFFYTSIIFNSEETAENLRKGGGYIPGYRPGQNTADYFDYILTRLTTVGAVYICAVCLLPEILITNNSIPFYLGGTSILIIVNVTIDSISQISMQFYGRRYKDAFKGKKSGKKRKRL